jgi:hypothetical protein
MGCIILFLLQLKIIKKNNIFLYVKNGFFFVASQFAKKRLAVKNELITFRQ